MKKIEAIIKPFMLEDVKNALTAVEICGMTISHVKGYGKQKGSVEYYRGAEVKANFIPKVKIEIVVNDDFKDKAIETIIYSARTGEIGDGKIFVSNIEEAIRIRTSESGGEVL